MIWRISVYFAVVQREILHALVNRRRNATARRELTLQQMMCPHPPSAKTNGGNQWCRYQMCIRCRVYLVYMSMPSSKAKEITKERVIRSLVDSPNVNTTPSSSSEFPVPTTDAPRKRPNKSKPVNQDVLDADSHPEEIQAMVMSAMTPVLEAQLASFQSMQTQMVQAQQAQQSGFMLQAQEAMWKMQSQFQDQLNQATNLLAMSARALEAPAQAAEAHQEEAAEGSWVLPPMDPESA